MLKMACVISWCLRWTLESDRLGSYSVFYILCDTDATLNSSPPIRARLVELVPAPALPLAGTVAEPAEHHKRSSGSSFSIHVHLYRSRSCFLAATVIYRVAQSLRGGAGAPESRAKHGLSNRMIKAKHTTQIPETKVNQSHHCFIILKILNSIYTSFILQEAPTHEINHGNSKHP